MIFRIMIMTMTRKGHEAFGVVFFSPDVSCEGDIFFLIGYVLHSLS